MTWLPALDASHRVADRDKDPHHHMPSPCGDACLCCGGLLIHEYTAALERDVTGTLVTLWRYVNCGDCVDHEILANRGEGSGSAGPHARLPTGPQCTSRPHGVETAA
jgi:hypothetical protein